MRAWYCHKTKYIIHVIHKCLICTLGTYGSAKGHQLILQLIIFVSLGKQLVSLGKPLDPSNFFIISCFKKNTGLYLTGTGLYINTLAWTFHSSYFHIVDFLANYCLLSALKHLHGQQVLFKYPYITAWD